MSDFKGRHFGGEIVLWAVRGGFEFTDTSDNRYRWRGELKAEYAQRIAQTFGTTLSRVAIDESEWLRRSARKCR